MNSQLFCSTSNDGRREDVKPDNQQLVKVNELVNNQQLKPCVCGAVVKVKQLMYINKAWKQDYDEVNDRLHKSNRRIEHLERENNELRQTSVGKASKDNEVAALKSQLELYREDYGATLTDMEKMNREIQLSHAVIEELRMEKENILAQLRVLVTPQTTRVERFLMPAIPPNSGRDVVDGQKSKMLACEN